MKRRTFIQSIGTAAAAAPVYGCSIIKRRYKPTGVMPRKVLGQTGVEVSRLGFGSHLMQSQVKNPKLRDRIIKTGYESGINIFDVYDHGGYMQFEPMGKSVNDIGRKNLLVSLVAVKPTEEMEGEIDYALKQFSTDFIDLYRNHIVDDDRMNILERNKQAGKLRFIGVVSHSVEDMSRYIDDYGGILDFVMIIYNFHHNIGRYTVPDRYPPNDNTALITRCENMGLGIIGIKPMGSNDMTKLASERGFFRDKKTNLAQAMLRHVFMKNEIDCAMPAMNSMKELVTNIEAAYDRTPSPYDTDILNRLSDTASSTRRAYLSPHYRWLEDWAVRTV